MSHDKTFLLSGSGLANKLNHSPICVYSTDNWELLKKVEFHFRGIQQIAFSPCDSYLISTGSHAEKSICLWDFKNMSVLDSKSTKFGLADLKFERKTSSNLLYFITISIEVLSFWRVDSKNKIEGFHVKLEDLTCEHDSLELITALEITDYQEQIGTSFILLGTSNGSILVVDKEKKILIKRICIIDDPVINIVLRNNRLIVTGEAPIVINWRISKEDLDNENPLAILEQEESKVQFVDDNIRAVSFSDLGVDGIVGSSAGSITYINLQEQAALKISNGHGSVSVNSVKVEDRFGMLFSSGE